MKKLLTSLIILLSMALGAQEKDSVLLAEYHENLYRAGVNMSPYEYLPGAQTAAPKGYKPFYISHYGRHGSRTGYDRGLYERVRKRYDKAHEAGLLTPKGEDVRERVAEIIRLHDGMDGRLTRLGTEEHRQIAQRMFRNYSRVFRKGSKKVSAVSSMVPRCIISMNAATGQILSMQKDLDFYWDTGETFQKYISSGHSKEARDSIKLIRKQYWKEHPLNKEAFMELVFTQPANARSAVGSISSLMQDTFRMAMACGAMGLDDSLFRIFTDDDLYWLAQNISLNFYLGQCNSVEFGAERLERARPGLDDIVSKADAAIATGEFCADLRYGHDYHLLSLASLLGFEGVAERMDAKSCVSWHGWRYTPYAANIQLVFYRNKKGDVLVKPLLNEREVRILGLVGGPYYDWNAYKAYLGY